MLFIYIIWVVNQKRTIRPSKSNSSRSLLKTRPRWSTL
jgi:hypothetical protein